MIFFIAYFKRRDDNKLTFRRSLSRVWSFRHLWTLLFVALADTPWNVPTMIHEPHPPIYGAGYIWLRMIDLASMVYW